jgi:biopolymer transport protein ExbD
MRLLVVAAIVASACGSGSAPISCELAGDHLYALSTVRELRTKLVELCVSSEWSAAARTCVAGVPSLDDLPSCKSELGASADPLDAAVRTARVVRTKLEAEKRSGIRIDLPNSRETEIDPGVASLVLEINKGADVIVGGKAIRDSDLDNLFRAAYMRDHETQVILKAARDVPHATLVNLMERAKQAGLTRLAIGTQPE